MLSLPAVALLLSLCLSLSAAAEDAVFFMSDSVEEEVDTLKPSQLWSAAPVIIYSPETRFGFGVGGMMYTRPHNRVKPGKSISNAGLIFLYTQNKQIRALGQYSLFFDQDRWRVAGEGGFEKFPNVFYGIGNDTKLEDEESFTNSYPYTSFSLMREVGANFFVGAIGLVERAKFTNFTDSGLLDMNLLTGSEGGFNWGIGPQIVYDTRDNVYAPYRGCFISASSAFYYQKLGSTFNYTDLQIDLRYFIDLPQSHVLGIQFYSQLIFGEPPWYKLSQLGGDVIMRGFFEGRYREQRYMALQTEWRFPIWNFVRGAAFVGAGDVANTFTDFQLSEFKYSGGLGLRLVLDPMERVNVRFDFGVGTGGVTGFYFQFAEAF